MTVGLLWWRRQNPAETKPAIDYRLHTYTAHCLVVSVVNQFKAVGRQNVGRWDVRLSSARMLYYVL